MEAEHERPLLNQSQDSDPEAVGLDLEGEVQEEKEPWYKARWVRVSAIGAGSLIVLLTVVVAFVVPPMAQKVVNESTLSTIRMFMTNPRADRLTLNATSELHDVGPVGATMLAANVEVHYEDSLLGTMEMPELDIVGGEVLRFELQTDMIVLNATAFTYATARILQGLGGVWHIRGKTNLKVPLLLGMHRTVEISLDKELLIPPTLLENVRGYKGDVVEGSGKKDTLDLVARTSLFSSSILEMHNLGEFVFDLYVLVDSHGKIVTSPDADVRAFSQVRVGEVTVDNFDLRQGVNDMFSRGRVIRNSNNSEILSQFMSSYLEGDDQLALFKGPTKSASLFLDNVVEQKIVFTGAADNRPVEASMLDGTVTFLGFSPDPFHPLNRFRGPLIVVHNTLSATVAQKNVSSFIYLEEPIAFNLSHPVLGNHHCPTSDKLAVLKTMPGMYKGNRSRAPIITFKPKQKKTVFMPGFPMASQEAFENECKVMGVALIPGADCCFIASQLAAACRAIKRGDTSFDTRLRTVFMMQVGEFEIPLDVRQDKIATMFPSDFTKGFVSNAELSCKHIQL